MYAAAIVLFSISALADSDFSLCKKLSESFMERAKIKGVSLQDKSKIERLFRYFKYRDCQNLDAHERSILKSSLGKGLEKQKILLHERQQKQMNAWLRNKQIQSTIDKNEHEERTSEIKLMGFRWERIHMELLGDGDIDRAYLRNQEEKEECFNYPLGCKLLFNPDGLPYLLVIEPVFGSFLVSVVDTSKKTYERLPKRRRAKINRRQICPDPRGCITSPMRSRKNRKLDHKINYRLASMPSKHDEILFAYAPTKPQLETELKELQKKLAELEQKRLFEMEEIKEPIDILFVINVCSFTVQRGPLSYRNHLDYAFHQIQEFTPILPKGSRFKLALTSVQNLWPHDHLFSQNFVELEHFLPAIEALKQHNLTFGELTQPDVIKEWMSRIPIPSQKIQNTLSEGLKPILDNMADWDVQPDLIVSFTDGWPATKKDEPAYVELTEGYVDKYDISDEHDPGDGDFFREINAVHQQSVPIQFKPIGVQHMEEYFREVPNRPRDKVLPKDLGYITSQVYLDLKKRILIIEKTISQTTKTSNK